MTSKKLRSAKRLALALSCITAGAFAQDQTGGFANSAFVTDLDFGIVCPTGERVKTPAPETVLGYIETLDGPLDILVTTQIVPAVKGISFGVKVLNNTGGPLEPITFTTKHPPFPGFSRTTERYQSGMDVEAQGAYFDFFTFDFPYEMQTGLWEFSAEFQGQELYRVQFNVVPATQATELVGLCQGPALLS